MDKYNSQIWINFVTRHSSFFNTNFHELTHEFIMNCFHRVGALSLQASRLRSGNRASPPLPHGRGAQRAGWVFHRASPIVNCKSSNRQIRCFVIPHSLLVYTPLSNRRGVGGEASVPIWFLSLEEGRVVPAEVIYIVGVGGVEGSVFVSQG